MDIQRVDPHLVEWSDDGAVALASETGGIHLLVPDAAKLLAHDIQWNRMRSPELAGRVIDMAWSPTGQSAYYECVLAGVLDTGDALILENSSGASEPWKLRSVHGSFTACAWCGSELLLSTEKGRLQALNSELEGQWTAAVPHEDRITRLTSSEGRIGAAFADGSVWVCGATRDKWELLVSPSRFRVGAIHFGTSGLIVARTDGVFGPLTGDFSQLSSYVPGHLLVSGDDWAIIHADGKVSLRAASGLTIPEIRGRVFGACSHSTAPLGILALGPAVSDWEYPIVSSQWMRLAFVPLPRRRALPRITESATPILWITHLVDPASVSIDDSEQTPPVLDALSLEDSLTALFTSPRFDQLRLKWYQSTPADRAQVVNIMRADIAQIICAEAPETELDSAIVRWYLAYAEPQADVKPFSIIIEGDFVTETFTVVPDEAATVQSESGRMWKRCALTLMPLLSLATRVSLDHEFCAYKTAPGDSKIASALLAAGRFCVFSGVQWERPRF